MQYEANKERILARQRERYRSDPERVLQRNRARRRLSGGLISQREWQAFKRRIERSPSTRVAYIIRARFKAALKQLKEAGTSKSSALNLIGCPPSELVAHLESQFTDGMSWSNHGLRGWHVDHIRPVVSFNLTNESELRACFHYTNLRPLWATENLRKGARQWN